MLLAIFRSRLRPDLGTDYEACNKRMKEIATSLPGFISVKGFVADDGERVSVHEWESAEQFRVWVEHPEHLEAKKRGQEDYYEDYACYVCDSPSVYGYRRDSGSTGRFTTSEEAAATIIVVFRSRIRPGVEDQYNACTQEMRKLAQPMAGFISVKAFHAEDGEKVAIHKWESTEHLRAWREHPEHVRVQERGRNEFYEEYSVYVCKQPRQYGFSRDTGREVIAD